MIFKIFLTISDTFSSYPCLIVINTISFLFKLCVLIFFISYSRKTRHKRDEHIYLFLVFIGAIVEDLAWIILLTKKVLFPTTIGFSIYFIDFIHRISWAFYALEYLALALFLESLTERNNEFNIRKKVCIIISSAFIIVFCLLTLINILLYEIAYIFSKIERLYVIYALFFLMPMAIFFTLKKMRKKKIPRLINQQLHILIQFLIAPRVISDLLQYFPYNFNPGQFTEGYAMNAISTLILSIALFYCLKKVIRLRFLNFQNHVQEHHRFNFVNGFKDTLEELAKATSMKELGHITQTFFKEAFHIPGNRVSLHFRNENPIEMSPYQPELSDVENTSEVFLSNTNPELEKCIHKVKILIYDEIDFNNFYDPNYADTTIIQFMDEINADIFLPIYKNHSIIGYIVVERYARFNDFYSDIERDEMLVFASYLGNIINLLQHRNLDSLIYQEKELKEELYRKHQEINQYKESIHSFLKNNKHKEIGIIFYKNRHFVFANQASKEIIKININTNLGSPLTKALRTIAQQVEEYKAPQSCITKNSDGERIVISGVPNLEKNHVIITVYYPDFTDILTTQINHLKDPSSWDYLLYLETTKPGQLINQLIPGSGEQLLQFKINLLQIALSKKALLLEMAHDDLIPTVELLHHISMRTNLHMLTLQGPSKNADIAIKLFGINPLLSSNANDTSKPLLEKLDGNGTLFIENIEFMDLESQEYLAEFIKYGYYRIFKSNQRMASSVRIICSTNQNLQTMVREGLFSQILFNELKKTLVSMPSLLTLAETELADLAQGLAAQAIKNDDFRTVLDLNHKDKNKIIQSKPASIHELKIRVKQLLSQKSKENHIDQEIHFDPAYEISDPELVQAARLGKHALRDQRIMNMLWEKFQNQNKIAAFLGVNRSSVNRRCKEYNLL